jgi:MFS transporter, NNP family, nitrate/nitrite transporter
VSGLGLFACAIAVTFTTPASMAEFPGFVAAMLGLFLFSGMGNASTFKQIPTIFPPRRAGGVIGWTAAVAAYGPFLFGALFGWSVAVFGTPNAVFWVAAGFYLVNVGINGWFYTRKGAEARC